MAENVVSGWVGLAVGAAAALAATGLGNAPHLVYLMDVHPGVAGWVQAIGSIAAIVAGFLVAAQSAAHAKRLAQESFERSQNDVALMEAEALMLVVAQLRTTAETFDRHCSESDWHLAEAARCKSDFEGVVRWIDNLKLGAMPSRRAASIAIRARTLATTALSLLDIITLGVASKRAPPRDLGKTLIVGAKALFDEITVIVPERR